MKLRGKIHWERGFDSDRVIPRAGRKTSRSLSVNKARGLAMLCGDVLIEAGSSAASDNLCGEDALRSQHVTYADNRARAGWSPTPLPLLRGFPPLRAQ